jgi:hypothetical protein
MSVRHFLHCRDCKEVFRPSPDDRAPSFTVTSAGVSAEQRDDCIAFLVRHARHALRTLRPTGVVHADGGLLADPMTVTYWEVVDGDELRLVCGWRERLDDPRQYRVIPGRLVADPATIAIPEDEIRAELDRALYPGVAAPRRLEAFVERFRNVVEALDPASLEIIYDVPSDATLAVAKLPEAALTELLAGLDQIFDAADAPRIASHLQGSTADHDAFSVLVRRPVRVELDAVA